jgi:hypothetical protein
MSNCKRLVTQIAVALILIPLQSPPLRADTSLVRQKINSIKTINEDVKTLEAQLAAVKSKGPSSVTTNRFLILLTQIEETAATITRIGTVTPGNMYALDHRIKQLRRERKELENEIKNNQREFENEIKKLEEMIARRREAIGTLIDQASAELDRTRKKQHDEASEELPHTGRVEKTFVNPKVGNFALDACLTWAKDCGKPAADRWCQEVAKFKSATTYTVSKNSPPTKVIGSGQVCDQWFCGRITSVTCQK